MRQRLLAGALALIALAALVFFCADALTVRASCHVIAQRLVYNERCWHSGHEEVCRAAPVSQPVYACMRVTPTPERR